MKRNALKPVFLLLTRELLSTLLLLFGISLVVFGTLYLAPGNPFPRLFQRSADIPASEAAADWYIYYLSWAGQVVQGDLGTSLRTGIPVLTEILRTGINTLILSGGALLLTLALAIPIAVYSARKENRLTSWMLAAPAYVVSAVPAFWFGYLIIFLAIRYLGIFPLAFASRSGSHRLLFYLLPILVLGLCSGVLSEMVRYLREEMIRVLSEEYIRAARAKGAAVWKHAFKEGFLIPVTEMVAAKIPFILGGAVVVEQVFNWPGMGRMAWQAAQDRDFPLIMGITLVSALIVRAGSLFKKVVHVAVNPRMGATG